MECQGLSAAHCVLNGSLTIALGDEHTNCSSSREPSSRQAGAEISNQSVALT